MSDPNNNNNVFPPREYDRQDSLSTIETIQTIDTKTTGGENNRVIVTLGSNDESDSNNNNNNNMTRTTILDGMARAQSHTVMLGALAANNNNNQQQQQQQLYSPSNETDPLASPTPKQGNHLSASPYAIMYGATTTDHHHSPQEHEFHYGSTDHQDSSSFVFPDPYAPRQSSCCSKWCCLFSPLTNCVREIWTSPALHRSFCYGSIDGMLTGAGIVAAFAGLGMLLPPDSSSTTHDAHMAALDDDDNGSNRYWYIVAFSAAACVADALCMALGHVWTTRNLIVHQVHERSVAKRAFLEEPTQRHLAKGELVERLVQQKGMLKIDAMSLADTLEGYPDLFVSALISDSLDGAATASHDEQQAYGTQYSSSNNNHPQGGPLRTIPSYGKVPHHDELDMDPDARMIRTAIRESMAESCFMFAGFSLFAVVPSLICCILPMMNTLESDNEDESANHAPLVKPQTLFLLLVCIIMSVLGAWKSRFIEGDTNALVFALEAVAVLIIGLCAGYAVGSFIVYMTGLELILVATKVSQEL